MKINRNLMLSLLVNFIFLLGIGFWLYSDAISCGRKPMKWFILGFLFGIFAIIVYYFRKYKYM